MKYDAMNNIIEDGNLYTSYRDGKCYPVREYKHIGLNSRDLKLSLKHFTDDELVLTFENLAEYTEFLREFHEHSTKKIQEYLEQYYPHFASSVAEARKKAQEKWDIRYKEIGAKTKKTLDFKEISAQERSERLGEFPKIPNQVMPKSHTHKGSIPKSEDSKEDTKKEDVKKKEESRNSGIPIGAILEIIGSQECHKRDRVENRLRRELDRLSEKNELLSQAAILLAKATKL